MDITLLIKSIAALIGAFAILIILYFYLSHTKKFAKKIQNIPEEQPDLSTLLEVIKDKKSTTQELKEAVDLILKYYWKIPKKLGMRVNPKFEIYSELLLRICQHPNTNKDIILKLDKELERFNPQYKLELDDSLTKGLNTRAI
ncbi:hypothetical protein [Sulfurimonas autotrophica]|uniref:Uncharacterized protein n=1 Tax=Sulfurimonas autotrophica (strain ATCC BAA-671 / DSM 16294 / JCM 11897 / OK10) TaxID=563040 RepID=E0UST9_SULAO|nr:hypothetical protein [Sulfurimonas autotrophica]ADN08116.1 conserved hypothetical protein [Sulfurimonas autotrophica DSM 16294]